jgi:hypothetical protein
MILPPADRASAAVRLCRLEHRSRGRRRKKRRRRRRGRRRRSPS